MPNQTIITASELHRSAGKVLKRVALQDEHLIVERDGYPVAVLLSYHEYEELMRLRGLRLHRQLVRALNQEADQQGLNEEQLQYEIREDQKEVYNSTYGSKSA